MKKIVQFFSQLFNKFNFIKTLPLKKYPSEKNSTHTPTQTKQLLGVLLCYNDADMLEDAITYLLNNNHKLVVWDHGSTDATSSILDRYNSVFLERRFIPRDFDFYKLYPTMSKNIIKNYAKKFDWVSWPDQDEILEGPDRKKSYYQYLIDMIDSPYNWVQFNNYNFWMTNEDDSTIPSPTKRIKHYCLFPDCAPRIRSWRASATNIREFNHNPLAGNPYPKHFNLKHYPMRSEAQMHKRIFQDRAGLQRGDSNFHYNNMKSSTDKLYIPAQQLHYDDGIHELNTNVIFPWRTIYGYAHSNGASQP